MKISIKQNIENKEERFIAHNAEMATSFFQRFRGLMFRPSFGEFDAMFLSPCSSIHTYFMKFPIDILCLDNNRVIVDMVSAIPPGKIFIPSKKTRSVLELPVGIIDNSRILLSSTLIFDCV